MARIYRNNLIFLQINIKNKTFKTLSIAHGKHFTTEMSKIDNKLKKHNKYKQNIYMQYMVKNGRYNMHNTNAVTHITKHTLCCTHIAHQMT